MFNHNDYLVRKLASQRQRELLEEARIHALVKEIRAGRPGVWERLFAATGEFLIVAGQRLKTRRQSSPQARFALQPTCSELAPCD